MPCSAEVPGAQACLTWTICSYDCHTMQPMDSYGWDGVKALMRGVEGGKANGFSLGVGVGFGGRGEGFKRYKWRLLGWWEGGARITRGGREGHGGRLRATNRGLILAHQVEAGLAQLIIPHTRSEMWRHHRCTHEEKQKPSKREIENGKIRWRE